jgi:hypothetical protein
VPTILRLGYLVSGLIEPEHFLSQIIPVIARSHIRDAEEHGNNQVQLGEICFHDILQSFEMGYFNFTSME